MHHEQLRMFGYGAQLQPFVPARGVPSAAHAATEARIYLGRCDVEGNKITVRAKTNSSRWRVELQDAKWVKPVTATATGSGSLTFDTVTITLQGAAKRTLTARVACLDDATGIWTGYGDWVALPNEELVPLEPEPVEEPIVVTASQELEGEVEKLHVEAAPVDMGEGALVAASLWTEQPPAEPPGLAQQAAQRAVEVLASEGETRSIGV